MTTERTSLLHPADDDTRLKPTVAVGIICTWIVTFLAAADSTITSTLSATIANEFNSPSLVSWLGTGYLIGLTATQPLSGKLSDIFGRRETFCFASVMFTFGNLISGLCRSKIVIIIARLVTGIGGGGCISIATFILSDNIPLRSRGFWQGISSVWYTAGMALGAVIGGATHDVFGWRWAFIGIAPISFIAGIGVAIFVPDHRQRIESFGEMLSRVDFAGAATLVSSLVLLLIGLNHEGTQIVTTLFAVTVPLGLVLLGYSCLLNGAGQRNLSSQCQCFMLGYSTSRTGLYLLPDGVGSGIGSALVGVMIGVTGRYGVFKYTMPALMVIASAGFMFVTEHTHWALPEIYLLCKGIGMGGAVTTLILALLHAVPHKQHATATSAYYAFRSTGCTIGLSAATAIFSARLNEHAVTTGTICVAGDACYLDALHRAFQLAFGFACAALISSFFIES
ncbi:unnamed protein product [Penicillium nalgiovense]|nr:unnamed protein product [Penicillium nalgiovense]